MKSVSESRVALLEQVSCSTDSHRKRIRVYYVLVYDVERSSVKHQTDENPILWNKNFIINLTFKHHPFKEPCLSGFKK